MARSLPLIGLLALASCLYPSAGEAAVGARAAASGCRTVAAPPAVTRTEPKPTGSLAPSASYDVKFQTNCGSFTIRLDQAQSPHAAVSFASLAADGFFDKTLFHRIAVGFVIQGGDPSQSGGGGPGYSTVDTPPANADYTHGVVAMAKTGSDPRGTAGSQFFVVTAPNAELPPDYAIIGKVTAGLDVVDRIGKLGNSLQRPTMVVEIEKATLSGPPIAKASGGTDWWWAIGGGVAIAVVLLVGGAVLLRLRRRERADST